MGTVTGGRGISRFLWILALMPALLLTSVPQSDAASSLCRKLERSLARASGGGGSSKVANAIRRQEAELGKAIRRARAAGCGGIRGLFGAGECSGINSTIRRMQSNLSNLRARSGSGGGGNFGERERILAAIDANECRNRRPREQLVRVEPEADRSLRDTLEEDRDDQARRDRRAEREEARRERRERREQQEREEQRDNVRKLPPAIERRDEERKRTAKREETDDSDDNGLLDYAGDTYRTLCVRTCDGYYFPVSFSTTKQNFGRDQKACDQMCPGSEVKLYYHHARDEESEDMVAVDGNRPYSALPAAFLYRTRGAAGSGACSCEQSAKNFTVIGGATEADKPEPDEPSPLAIEDGKPVPVNTWRLDPLIDPETYANLRGGFDKEKQKSFLSGAGDTQIAKKDGERDVNVRVVGPAFLPDPEGAIDLRSPAPTIVQ